MCTLSSRARRVHSQLITRRSRKRLYELVVELVNVVGVTVAARVPRYERARTSSSSISKFGEATIGDRASNSLHFVDACTCRDKERVLLWILSPKTFVASTRTLRETLRNSLSAHRPIANLQPATRKKRRTRTSDRKSYSQGLGSKNRAWTAFEKCRARRDLPPSGAHSW